MSGRPFVAQFPANSIEQVVRCSTRGFAEVARVDLGNKEVAPRFDGNESLKHLVRGHRAGLLGARPRVAEGSPAPSIEGGASIDDVGVAWATAVLEELRWRIRHRTEAIAKHLDGMTKPLISEMQDGVGLLLERVAKEAAKPTVHAVVHAKFGRATLSLSGSGEGIRQAVETDVAMPIKPR